MQLLVVAAERYKFFVRATLYDLALVHYAYLVGVLDGRQAVGDSHRCARLHKALQRVLHEAFALGVECRCSLVEDENWRVLQYGARYAHALSLSA